MLSRLICLLLGHVLDDLDVIEGAQPPIYICRGKCARCDAPIVEVCDLRDEYDPPPTQEDL
jgi:hypothetical protein